MAYFGSQSNFNGDFKDLLGHISQQGSQSNWYKDQKPYQAYMVGAPLSTSSMKSQSTSQLRE